MRRSLLIILLGLLTLHATESRSQPSYWIALNFRVTFNADGTATVDAKLHPFTVDGKSLFENKEVEVAMRNQTSQTLSYILLMFSDNPRLLNFQVLTQMDKRYGESVLCDAAGTGKMTEFRGAYVLSVKVFLNTSNYVRKINDSVFEVKLRDSFTSTDPRSWIDVLEIVFNGTTLENFAWEPFFAHGPSAKGQGRLMWINFNEQEAPDIYSFILVIPGLKHVGEPPEVTAAITDAVLEGGTLRLKIKNTGGSSGYVYVYVKGGSEQVRKIYLFSREEKEVAFPYVDSKNVVVQLFSGDRLLDERSVAALEGAPTPALKRTSVYVTILVIIAIFVATVFALVAIRGSRKKSLGLSGVLGGSQISY
ncbi:hypothetical protein [Infirmifilum sp. NZ]|uniref:hypothetical protein n=1 Tax=Infirmifilum sp. NZ TaxID=2926850 RepID=UPI0027A6F4C0|nr:hypothetical protein [Infirmifilum sp. NZ]UNQ74154.1 hypothetical protein MOV14_03830 [Infirmifilum sp. NZ]